MDGGPLQGQRCVTPGVGGGIQQRHIHVHRGLDELVAAHVHGAEHEAEALPVGCHQGLAAEAQAGLGPGEAAREQARGQGEAEEPEQRLQRGQGAGRETIGADVAIAHRGEGLGAEEEGVHGPVRQGHAARPREVLHADAEVKAREEGVGDHEAQEEQGQEAGPPHGDEVMVELVAAEARQAHPPHIEGAVLVEAAPGAGLDAKAEIVVHLGAAEAEGHGVPWEK